MKRYTLSLVIVLLFVLRLSAQNTAVQVFDVRKYGAKGDGTTDDRTAINAAIVAAEAVGGGARVQFPRGTYLINGFIQVNATGSIVLEGSGAVLKQGSGSGNQLLFIGKDDVVVEGLELNGNYPTVNNVGSGIGINILADNAEIRRCYVHHTEGEGIASQTGSGLVKFLECHVESSGTGGIHAKGDSIFIHNCLIESWNVTGTASGVRGIECDPQEVDAESVEIVDTRLRLDSDTGFTDGILVDAGDNDLTTGDSTRTPFGNSGTATEDGDDSAGAANSYIRYTLDAGHGFQVGDSIWVDGSGIAVIDGAGLTGKSHVIRAIGGTTGNVYARSTGSTTLTLHRSPAEARSASNAVDLTSSGTGTTYISATRSGRNTIASVDTSTETITTASAHGFITGEMVRLTQGASTTVFPGGLTNSGTITLNAQFPDDGNVGSSATYMRPKRVRNVTLRNVVVDWHPSDSADCNGLKFNNIENLTLDRVIVNEPAEYTGDTAASIRLGQGLRKVSMTDCKLTGTLLNNVIAYIPELSVERCEIGGGANLPQSSITTMACGKFTLRDSILRNSLTAIDVADINYLRDEDIIEWVITDNIFEGNSSSRCRVFDIGSSLQLVNSRKVRYYNNERRNVGSYTGLSISSLNTTSEVITMSTHHQLQTGDMVKMDSSSAPGGTTDEAWYFIRKTGDTTLKLYTTLAEACADTNAVNLSSSGSGSVLWSPKIGVQFSNNGNRDHLFFQNNDSGREFRNVAVPSGTTVAYNAGDIVWAMNPTRDDPPGWYCTASGLVGTSVGTFVDLPALAPTNALVADVAEVGNVNTGEDNLITYTLPANTLNESGASLEIEAGFTFAANANSKTIKLYFGSTDLLSLAGAAQNAGSYHVRAVVVRDASNIAKVSVVGGTYGGSGTPLGNIPGNVFNHIADMTTALTIKGTGTATSGDGSGTSDVVMQYLRVKTTPAP